MCKKILSILILSLCVIQSSIVIASEDHLFLKGVAENFKATEAEKKAGAVILKKHENAILIKDWEAEYQNHYVIAVLNEKAAREYSEISFWFNSYFEEIELDYARLIDRDGVVHELQEDAVQIKAAVEKGYFSDSKKLTFSLPSVRPGSIFEYQVTRRPIKPRLGKQWYSLFSFYKPQGTSNSVRIDPVRQYIATIENRTKRKLHVTSKNTKIKPKIKRKGGVEILKLQAKNLQQVEIEPSMPPLWDGLPSVLISTMRKWSELDKELQVFYPTHLDVGPEVLALAKKIAKPGMTRDEKIQAVYYYMQSNIRYVSADFQRNGYKPHSPDMVLQNRYGDCKDQTVLIRSILHAMGIESYPALTSYVPELQPFDDMPAMFFSHMIVYVPDGKKGIWLDASGSVSSYPGIDWLLQGRKAFVLNGKGGLLTKIPIDPPEKNKVNVVVDLEVENNSVVGGFSLSMTGIYSNRFKVWHNQSPTLDQDLSNVIRGFFPAAEIVALDYKQEEGSRGNYQIKAKLSFPTDDMDLSKKVVVGASMVEVFRSFTDFLSYNKVEKRKYDFVFSFPNQINFELNLKKPGKDFAHLFLESDLDKKYESFDLKRVISTEKDKISGLLSFTVNDYILPAWQYNNFIDEVNSIQEGSRYYLSYQLDANESKKQNIDFMASKSSENIDELIVLVKESMSVGEYDQALRLATSAVSIDINHPEANYLLGLAQGFTGAYDESKKSFSKASELGYRP